MSSISLFLNRVVSRNGFLALGLAALLALAPAVAEARLGNGSSAGSRGSKTFSAPPATSTAPHSAAPMERSMTQQPAHSPAASAAAAAPARSGMFSGFGGGLMAGLLGAGLVGMLFGHGMTGGLGDLGSILGLVLQLALLFFVVRFAMSWFANRNRPAMAGVSERSAYQGGPAPGPQGGFGGFGGGAAPQQPQAPVTAPIQLQDSDFNAFERLLGESQSAYSDENIDRLRALATPEMVAYFSQEIAEHARKGVINRISGVKLLQGDLSEAWREGGEEYASVAMRFALIDVMQDRAFVPGSFELPLAAQKAFEKGFDAVVVLGLVLKGETPHFDYVCQGVTQGVMDVQLKFSKPIGFGVLMCNNLEQAIARSGITGSKEDKGYDSAIAALSLLAQ